MNRELKNRLQQHNWDDLYRRFIPGMASSPNANAECRACSPFPDVVDRHASFSVNVITGEWYCFKTGRGGDYVLFRAIMEAEEYDSASGLAIPNYSETERRLNIEFGVSRPVDIDWINGCRDLLYNDLALRQGFQRYKPWNADVMYQLNIGYSSEHDRFVFPICDRKGRIVNCRMYRPGCEPKMLWLEQGLSGNILWPHVGWRDKSVMLVEGEPDALSLRSFGFPAVTGTMGASLPVPDGEWFRDRIVYILMDSDDKGQEAAQEACRRMSELAKELFVVKLPDWNNRPHKADISDYLMHLLSLNYEFDQIQRCITQLLVDAEKVEISNSFIDEQAIDTLFSQAITGQHQNRRVKFTSRVTAKSSSRFFLPVAYQMMCPAEGHSYCKRCPMKDNFHGSARFMYDPRRNESLKLIQTSEENQLKELCKIHGIPNQCPDIRMRVIQAADIEAVIVNSSIAEGEGEADIISSERARREAYVIVPNGETLEENRDYTMEGLVYAHPKSQHGVFLIDKFTPHATIFDKFENSSHVVEQLSIFRPSENESVFNKLVSVSKDMSDSVTMILGRTDLHLAYRTVWHSVLNFYFSGKLVTRGWLECLVLGDTRCGKSETFKRMAQYYGLGLLIDCKMQTSAGILGTVVQSASGEYYVVAGLLPQQDGRVVCFDEFTVPRNQGRSIIEELSSTRSDGIVRISKAAQGEFRARVRSIWLANPGTGKLIAQCSESGVELISRVINQPEDIARFDLALTVSQSDVNPQVINSVKIPVPPTYTQVLGRTLLAWLYSRKPNQIVFTKDAESAVIDLAMRMHKRYDPSIPLVEIADQRTRIAKVAVSVAAQCFSTDALGDNLIVTEKHVEATEQLYAVWYDKPVMGYNVYSANHSVDQSLEDENEVMMLFTETVNPHGKRLAEELLRLDEFTERTLGTIVPIEGMFTRSLLQVLYKNRAIHLMHRGKKESYEKTPAFTSFLKYYLSLVNSNHPSNT